MKTISLFRQRGLTLIELMVAMAVGLILMLGATGILLSNQHSFRSTENIADIQKGARISVDLLAREIREAGSNPCGALPLVSTVNPGVASVGLYWSTPIRGYDDAQAAALIGGNPANRAANTDALLLTRSGDQTLAISDHNPMAAQLKVNGNATNTSGIEDGSIVIACGKENAAVLQVTNITFNNGEGKTTLVHNTGTGVPGNCTKGLGYTNTPCVGKDVYRTFTGGALASSESSFWYIGNNPRGGLSLYRRALSENPVADVEMVDNVYDMQLRYLRRNRVAATTAADFVDAMATDAEWLPTDANPVVAVEINLTLCGPTTIENAAAVTVCPAGTLERQVSSIVQIRSREVL